MPPCYKKSKTRRRNVRVSRPETGKTLTITRRFRRDTSTGPNRARRVELFCVTRRRRGTRTPRSSDTNRRDSGDTLSHVRRARCREARTRSGIHDGLPACEPNTGKGRLPGLSRRRPISTPEFTPPRPSSVRVSSPVGQARRVAYRIVYRRLRPIGPKNAYRDAI